jgi:hypothetical protein
VRKEQQKLIDYILIENQVLKERYGKKRILFNNNSKP